MSTTANQARTFLWLAAIAALAQLSTAAEPAQSDEPVTLDDFEVRGTRSDSNYKVDRTSSAMRVETPLIDVPQSIAIITQEQIRDQQMTSLGDVVRYVPGVASHQGENNRDQIIFRGNSSSADFFLNGVRDDVQYYRDLYNLESVEVLRGPNAMVFGRGGGGGVINRTTKEATFLPLHAFTLQASSLGGGRATVDVDEPLGKQVAVRLNGFYENSDSFRDHVSLERYGVNPTATFSPSEATKVTAAFEYLLDRRVADRGITSYQGRPADVPIETYYGNPDDSHVRANANLFTGTFEHRIGGLTIRNRTMFGDYDRFYQNYVPGAVNAAKTTVALTAYNNATRRENLFSQTDLSYVLTTGQTRHTLVGGFELGAQRTDNFRQTGYFNHTATASLVPFDKPTITTPVTYRQSATDADNHLETDLGAIYVQDQIELSAHLQAVAGVRFDSFDLTYHNNRNGDTLSRKDDFTSPRLGLILKPEKTVSIYGSYSVSFLPSSGDQFSSLTVITQQMKPEEFRNLEVGAKWDLRRDWFLTTAAYQLDRTNTRATDPNDPTRILQTGAQRTRGVELGVTGAVRRDWTIFAGYAYQDAFIRSATTAAPAGTRVPQVPRNSFSLWNKYQVIPKLAIGLGVVYRSDVFASIDNTVTLPAFTRVDLAVFYNVSETWRLQANVENLLDRTYFNNADSNTNISPGSPRAVRVALDARF